MKPSKTSTALALALAAGAVAPLATAQLRDVKEKISGNTVNEGIQKNLPEQIGAGRGNLLTQGSSAYIIARDPFRAIRRGRQLFQRKFLPTQGFNGRDRSGNIQLDPSVGAGIVDSCAGCHGRPRGSAGSGGDVFTRPDSRDAPHLFGLGLQEMLADEMTSELRAQRAALAIGQTTALTAKGVSFGSITRTGASTFNTANVVGVNPDLRVRPFFAQGGTISIREFLVGAFNAEMGLQADDSDLRAAAINRQRIVTPAGMVLDGALDAIEAPPVTGSNGVDPDGDGISNELPQSLVDFEEFYLLHYFKAATHVDSTDPSRVTEVNNGRSLFTATGCASCHVPSLTINRDRRIADVETNFDAAQSNPFNRLFATASAFPFTIDDPPADPVIKTFASNPAFAESAAQPARSFVVNNFFADLKRHDLGSGFWERNFDGTLQRQMMTEPLWGVATTAPYGHDGRTHSLEEVILRHGGEALGARNGFAGLSRANKNQLLAFLGSLVLFSPDDIASNLAPANPAAANFPQSGHGAIALTVLFNNPADRE
jgi:mono/diheme cytochrome c family protein